MSVSVIIPTLNEAACLPETLRDVRRQQPCEIIVVDGGSSDGTLAAAKAADRVIVAAPGRARQMNAGAHQATGDILLFLHADCTLEAGALDAAGSALRRTRTIAGCFTMRVQANGILYRSIDICATARVRLTGLIYGDQGLFLRRADLIRLGGFPDVPFMEDVFFSRALRRLGRIEVVPPHIFVSPRRWQRAGLIRQTFRNWGLTALAALGVSPHRLARFYPSVR